MTITINGTTGIAGVDGSAGTPAVQGTDTNTGIFFPAADTIAFGEGGAEVMRINSSGNVGIGTSSPTAVASYRVLQITGGSTTQGGLVRLETSDGTSGVMRIYQGNVAGSIEVSSNLPLTFLTNSTEQARITAAGLFQFNSGYGSVATAYGCRAWVNFNGTSTVAIRASGNVTSITDNGTGDYTVNFTTAMPDANYSWNINADRNTAPITQINSGTAAPTASALRLFCYNTALAVADSAYVVVTIVR